MEPSNDNDLHASEIIYKLPDDVPVRYLKDGAFIFIAYGCALTERQTPSGMYVYTAVNLNTGRQEILSRRKVKLDENGFVGMAVKVSASPVRGDGLLNIDRKPGESVKTEALNDIAERLFKEILPQYGYAVRENQIELAAHILTVTGRRGITLAESEVGTGKTHAYLAAAALIKRGRLNDIHLRGHYHQQSYAESANMPVVISTSSIALQKAIDTDYIPELSKIMLRHGIINTPLTSAVRKGKEHYICERRFQRLHGNADKPTQELLEPFAGADAPFDLTGIDSLSAYLKRSICVSGKCADGCPYATICRYRNHMKKINDPRIDFQITNHNYFLADTLHRARGKRPLLPYYQLVIIDEAHKFLAAARSMYGLELTDDELPRLAQDIHAFTIGKSNSGVNVHREAKRMEEQSDKMFGRLNDNIPETDEDDDAERFPAVMDAEVLRYLKKIASISNDLAVAVTDSHVPKPYRDRQSKAIWRLNMTEERVSGLREQNRLIHWLEKRVEGETETDALCAIPKDLDERLHRDLWNNGIPIVLTSGTLSASGDFTRAKRTLGLDRMPSHKLFDVTMPSPFDYKNNALIYISENTPFPDSKTYEDNAVGKLSDERFEQLSGTYEREQAELKQPMGQVHAILNRRGLPFPLFRLERGGVQAIDRFKRSGNGILLASGALWEGIDIPGDALSMLILVKLPYAVPDPIGDFERSQYSSFAAYKAAVLDPDMLVKDKQGYGRGIRTETDTCVFAFLDSRLRRIGGSCRMMLLASLPYCRVTDSVRVVSNFYLDKKDKSYFDPKPKEAFR